MDKTHGKVVLVTGASSGFGRACGEHLARLGHRVYGTSRKVGNGAPTEGGPEPGSAPAGSPEMIPMDVDRDDSVRLGVAAVMEREGRIDVVVNNAGLGLAGAVEETSVEEGKALFETNLWGVHRICRAVLPAMRARRSGLIVNIGSLGGRIGIPFQGFYSASKFALEGLTEALRMEVRSFGIHVVLIAPGDGRTEFTTNRRRTETAGRSGAYAKACERAVKTMVRDEMGGFPPERVARCLVKILEDPSPKLRYTVASPFQRSAVKAKSLLPDSTFEALLMRYYGLE